MCFLYAKQTIKQLTSKRLGIDSEKQIQLLAPVSCCQGLKDLTQFILNLAG